MQYAIEVSSRCKNFVKFHMVVYKHLGCDGQSLWCVQNFVRKLIVKGFCKSVYICQSYDQKLSVSFFKLMV